MREIFLDTSYFIALLNSRDEYHHAAKNWAMILATETIHCHLSVPILFELADGFSRLGRREIGISLIEQLVNTLDYVIHPFSMATYDKARKLYLSRRDKEWGLTDCYSFELMKELRLTKALTADKHFEQFGFEILLKSAI